MTKFIVTVVHMKTGNILSRETFDTIDQGAWNGLRTRLRFYGWGGANGSEGLPMNVPPLCETWLMAYRRLRPDGFKQDVSPVDRATSGLDPDEIQYEIQPY